MGRGSARRWCTRGSAAGLLGVALAIFVSGASATHGENVFAGQWQTNTGSIRYQAVDPQTGAQAIVAQGGRTCASPTVYYVGTYSDPGPHTGVASGCTVGGPNHLVGRYVGDPVTDAGAAGNIDITFSAPNAFTGTYKSDSSSSSFAYTGTFAGHFSGDGCCPAPPPTTTTTTTTPPGPADVRGASVDPLFPVTGLAFAGPLASFQSSSGAGGFTATIDWGDGSPPSDGTVGAPVRAGAAFVRSVSGRHTYAASGDYPVVVTVTDPHGASARAANDAAVTDCVCATRPPVFARTVDVGLVSGQVFIQLPRGARSAGAAAVKGTGFVALTTAREIPVGSVIDAQRGKLVVRAATTTTGPLGAGLFSSGTFQLLQNRRERGITEVRLRSSASPARVCRTAGKVRTAAARPLSKKVLGFLRSSVKGQFRSRGRFASATVRGTEWTMADRCDGTLTQVTRGAVTVLDFRARRSIVVTAGRSYLAPAR